MPISSNPPARAWRRRSIGFPSSSVGAARAPLQTLCSTKTSARKARVAARILGRASAPTPPFRRDTRIVPAPSQYRTARTRNRIPTAASFLAIDTKWTPPLGTVDATRCWSRRTPRRNFACDPNKRRDIEARYSSCPIYPGSGSTFSYSFLNSGSAQNLLRSRFPQSHGFCPDALGRRETAELDDDVFIDAQLFHRRHVRSMWAAVRHIRRRAASARPPRSAQSVRPIRQHPYRRCPLSTLISRPAPSSCGMMPTSHPY